MKHSRVRIYLPLCKRFAREFKFEARHSPNIAFHGTPIRALRGLGPVNFSR